MWSKFTYIIVIDSSQNIISKSWEVKLQHLGNVACGEKFEHIYCPLYITIGTSQFPQHGEVCLVNGLQRHGNRSWGS